MINSKTKDRTDQTPMSAFPDHFVPESQKGKKWCLQYAKAMWSRHLLSPFANYRNQIYENLLYAKGKQNIDQYKQKMDPGSVAEGKKVGQETTIYNLDWTAFKFLPKMIDILVGYLAQVRVVPTATSIDPAGRDARLEEEFFLRAMNDMRGPFRNSQLFQQLSEGLPVGEEAIDQYMSDHKTDIELAMEEGLQVVQNHADWDAVLHTMILRDLINTGMSGGKIWVDKHGMPQIRKCTPSNMVIGAIKYPDMREVPHMGEVVFFTIQELKKMDVNNEVPEKTWKQLATMYTGRYGNPDGSLGKSSYFPTGTSTPGSISYNTYSYDSFTIPVLDFECKTQNKRVFEKKHNKYGRYSLRERDLDYRPPKKSKFKREVLDGTYECTYKGLWVINTDLIFDYGKADYQVRGYKSDNTYHAARFSYFYYVIGAEEDSMVPVAHTERAIRVMNSIQLELLRLDNLIARFGPPRAAIDVESLFVTADKLGMSQNERGVLRLVEIMNESGVMLYSFERNDDGAINPTPVKSLGDGSGDVTPILSSLASKMEMLRDVLGLNAFTDSSTPNPESLVGVAQYAAGGTTNSLHPLIAAYKSIYRQMTFISARKLQKSVAERQDAGKPELSGYIKAIGQDKLKAIAISSKIGYAEFSFDVEDVPDDAAVLRLEQLVMNAINRRNSTGAGGLTEGVAMKAMRLARKNVKEAERFVEQKLNEQRQKDDMSRTLEVRANAEAQAQAAQAAEAAKRETLVLESELKMKEIELTKQWEMKIALLKAKGSMSETEIKAQAEMRKLEETPENPAGQEQLQLPKAQ